jgi:hypothetical protein
MPYIYGAPCKARNFNVVYYIYRPTFGNAESRLFLQYFLDKVSTLNQFRKLSCGTVVCKHFASYQDYPNYKWDLTFSLLMSYIYMERLVKPEILTSYIYGPTFGNAESRLFLFAAQCFNTESM